MQRREGDFNAEAQRAQRDAEGDFDANGRRGGDSRRFFDLSLRFCVETATMDAL